MGSDLARSVAIADRLIEAYDAAVMIELITAGDADFNLDAAYDVLRRIEADRQARGWRPVGRKIGFTNTTIWDRYGVSGPMWARTWDRTVSFTRGGAAQLALDKFVQPRIEPEIVFGLAAQPPVSGDAEQLLTCVEWMAAGFEIVQCHFRDWRFGAPDCTAAFGLHGALVVGAPIIITDRNRTSVAATLATFDLALSCGGSVVEHGTGANVLGSPALALGYLARTVAEQPAFSPLARGEIITTGTLTDAWPIQPGQQWESDYGSLGVDGLAITFS